MASNRNKRPASDWDDCEPSKLDKKKAKKLLNKHPRPQVSKSRQPDPYLRESEEDVDSEGEMEVASTDKFDSSPFIIDITDDMCKFWQSEAHVLVGVQKFYANLEIRVTKSQKAAFIITNLRSLSGKPISFMQMDARLHLLTAILCKVPHALTKDLIEGIAQQVAKATHMTCWSAQMQETVPTMSVKIIWEGETIT